MVSKRRQQAPFQAGEETARQRGSSTAAETETLGGSAVPDG